MKWMLLLCGLLSLPSFAASLYLCKAPSGGTFWSQESCGFHNAPVENIVNVPDGLSFDQQVSLGKQSMRSASPSGVTPNSPGADRQSECKALADQISRYDAMARQPQAGQSQDWITSQKRTAQSQQSQLKC